MSEKFKRFSDLSSRQKRRRLLTTRDNRIDEQDFTADEHEIEEEILENVTPEDLQNPHHEQSSDNEVSETSSTEDSEEILDNNISINTDDETSAFELSDLEQEDENVYVHRNIRDSQRTALKNAFLNANINHKQGNIILKTLRRFPFNLISLPKDSRTVLNTPTVVASSKITLIEGGEYLHIGFKKTLIKQLESLPPNSLPEALAIDLSTDGAKVDKGEFQFWPHQYKIFNIPNSKPFIVGIYKGKGKPSDIFAFYEQLIQEITTIREEGGIAIYGRHLPVTVRCLIADAPARALVLNHFGHNSVKSCSKCKVEGHRCTVKGFERTTVFVGIRHERRTDQEYRNLLDDDHHKGGSPLSTVLGLVTRVPF